MAVAGVRLPPPGAVMTAPAPEGADVIGFGPLPPELRGIYKRCLPLLRHGLCGAAIRRAIEAQAEHEGLGNGAAEVALRVLAAPSENRRLIALTVAELQALDRPPRELVLDPWLRVKDLVQVFARRGIGKTRFLIGVAEAVATGGDFLAWKAPAARPVLYVDGELPIEDVKALFRVPGTGDRLQIITPDKQDHPIPSLATGNGQALIEEHLQGGEVLILDSLSTLNRGAGPENDAESWDLFQDWLLALRRQNVTVLFAHHAGKSGTQRGTSKREDVLDSVLALKHPPDYVAADGCRFELHFEKARGIYGAAVEPLEARLRADPDGRPTWTWKSGELARRDRVLALAREGLTVTEIANELDIHKGNVSRILKRAREEGILDDPN
jgi:hypothetical protein